MTGLPAGWRDVDDAARLEDELRREIQEGHPLWGRPVRALARAETGDDFLLELDGGAQLAVVHLTWKENDRPPWPWTTFYAGFEAFAADA